MKIILRTALIAGLMLTTSCGKETANIIADIFDKEVEELESTALDIENVTDNVLIEGATKMEGTPPTSNGAISLDISDTGKTAFLDEGFDVSLTSDAVITGAFIQFKSKDGSLSDSYYDVNLEMNNSGKASKSLRRRRVSKNNSFSTISKTDDVLLDVDFNSNIQPGEFCYEICVYDANGSISEPQEVCVRVEAWGGNSAMVGKWQLIKTYKDSAPDDFQALNVENCEMETTERSCNLDTFTVTFDREDCDKIESFEITMNNDGTYTEKFMEIDKTMISNVQIPSGMTMSDLENFCMYSFSNREAILTYDGDGKWAYQSDTDSFIFIEYNYREAYDGDVYEDSFEPGDGSLYYGAGGDNGEVKLVDGKLIVSSFEFRTSEFEK